MRPVKSNLPACLAEVQLDESTIWYLCYRTGEIDRYYGWNMNQHEFSIQQPREWKVFCIPVRNITVFQLRIWTGFRSVGIRSSVFFKLINSRIWPLLHSCKTGFWKYFAISLAWKWWNMKMDGMLILGKNYLFCRHSVVDFQYYLSN